MVCVEVVVVEPAKFSVSNIRVEPSEPTTLDQIKVYADVFNSGGVGGYATVQLTVDGNVIMTDEVYVEAGQKKGISYTIDKLPAGSHNICIDIVGG